MLEKLARKVVRHIENNQRVRLLRLVSDWVIDDDDQPWLVWASDAKAAGTLPRVTSAEGRGRAQSRARSRSRSRSPSRSRSRSRSPSPIETTRRLHSASSQEFARTMEYQVGHASQRVEGAAHEAVSIRKRGAAFRFDLSTPSAAKDPFPSPFQCAGDFCAFAVHDPKGLKETGEASAIDIAREMLSKEEWDDLVKRMGIASTEDQDSSRGTTLHRALSTTYPSSRSPSLEESGGCSRAQAAT